MHKQLCSINKQNYSKALCHKTLEQQNNVLQSRYNYYIDESFRKHFRKHLASFGAPIMYSVDKNMSQVIKITAYQKVTEM